LAGALAGLFLALPAAAQVLEMPPGTRIAPTLPAPGARIAQMAPATPADAGQGPTRATPPPITLRMEAGVGRLVRLPAPAVTVLAADPRIARVQPASSTSLFVMAVGPGRTTIVAAAQDGSPVAEYDVTVQPGRATAAPAEPAMPPIAPAAAPAAGGSPATAGAIQTMVRRLVPAGAGVTVAGNATNGFIISGTVPTAAESARIEAITRGMGGADAVVQNALSVMSSIQVNLRVRVAEISRQVTRDLGFNWQVLAQNAPGWALGLRTAGAAGALPGRFTTGAAETVINSIAGAGGAATGGRYGVGGSVRNFDINAIIDALAQDQLITILAEPNLTAQSGETASFLAGGEFPIPVSASPLNGSLTIEFKQFGVSLAFVPTVLGPDRLNLRVRPEVSELTDNGAINLPLSGGVVRIPALSVRRAETTVELGSGQSFAIAGLLQQSSTGVNTGLPGLGDIPVFGTLFRSDRFRRSETELVIIITPYLVQPTSSARSLTTPVDAFRPATDLDRVLFRRQVARGASARPIAGRLDAGFILE
jgi:pilus assembly protein CpaC